MTSLRDSTRVVREILSEAAYKVIDTWTTGGSSGNPSAKETPVTKADAKPPEGLKSFKPQKPLKPAKWVSAGGVVLFSVTTEGLNKVLLVSPKNAYGGYNWTFPKGKVDEGEILVKTAKREVREETGIEAALLPGGYLGEGEGTMSTTHYYMMVRVSGEPGAGTDGESAKVEWVAWSDAFKRFKGSSRDKKILLRAWDFTRKLRKKL